MHHEYKQLCILTNSFFCLFVFISIANDAQKDVQPDSLRLEFQSDYIRSWKVFMKKETLIMIVNNKNQTLYHIVSWYKTCLAH